MASTFSLEINLTFYALAEKSTILRIIIEIVSDVHFSIPSK